MGREWDIPGYVSPEQAREQAQESKYRDLQRQMNVLREQYEQLQAQLVELLKARK